MRIADERQLGLDTSHGLEVMGPLHQRDASDRAAEGPGNDVVNPVRRVSAYGSATHRRERDHEQVDQLIRAIAHQMLSAPTPSSEPPGRPDLIGQRVGVTVNPGRLPP